jgi:hypothetical protein
MADRPWLWPARVLLAAAILAGLASLSNLPLGREPEQGVVRLAWRMVGERVSLCRTRSPEELERTVAHMRQPLACRVRLLPYRLQVTLDGARIIDRPVVSAGAQGDRPLYVQEDLPLVPGPHRLEMTFTASPELARGAGGIEVSSEEERATLEAALAKARSFRLERSLASRAGRIVLIELDEQAGEFRVTGN